MAIIKCKMCGGDLVLTAGSTVAECEYCGTRQTVPVADSEKKMMLFARANRLRASCEFDKAAGIYEAIVAEFPQEAESYWGLVLCKYGIEYVDDPATGKKVPTCHRSSFESVLEDSNFDQAMENADEVALSVYRQEAKQIETIRRGILEVSSSEKPYDIFICYKETDVSGDRSVDSLLAQDIYDALTDKGYRVFFSRISLEDKLGQAYEPYIFAALNSAKIMLAVGTCYEHYNAVWVKNEWSRYLKIIAQDKGKYLIPCYKNIDAYDIPKEFAHLQGQDMGKVGAIADLLRGIEKLMPLDLKASARETAGSGKIAALLDRGHMALEDGNWAAADRFFEEVLNSDIKNADGYLGKLLAEYKLSRADDLGTCAADYTSSYNYQKARQFGDDGIQKILEDAGKDRIYYAARKLMEENTKFACQKAAAQLQNIPGWRDADTLVEACRTRIAELEAARKKTRIKDQQGKKKSKVLPLATAVIALVAVAGILLLKSSDQNVRVETESVTADPQEEAYLAALSLMEAEKYEEAINAFTQLAGYADTEEQIENCRLAIENAALEAQYQEAEALAAEGKHAHAGIAFAKLNGYKDARERSFEEWGYARPKATVAVGSTFFADYGIPYLIGLRNDGTAVLAENTVNTAIVSQWTDLVGVYMFGQSLPMGVKADGTVVCGEPIIRVQHFFDYDMESFRKQIGQWKDIVYLYGYGGSVCGLTRGGKLVYADLGGDEDYASEINSKLSELTDIVDLPGGYFVEAALRWDGTVVPFDPESDMGKEMATWENIVAVDDRSGYGVVGLCADGTVNVAEYSMAGQTHHGKVEGLTDVVDLAMYTALKSDGTVNFVWLDGIENRYIDDIYNRWKDAIDSWDNITSLCTDRDVYYNGNLYGLKADGTVVVAGRGYKAEVAKKWTDIARIVPTYDGVMGIKNDGTVVMNGEQNTGARNWTNIATQ
ncbi:MAG: toll/interleukin-1 receptor domain-containing protein [Oscillospiraceae bacterium]